MKACLGNHLIQRGNRRTWAFSACCLAGVLLLCATGLLPAFTKGRQLHQSISNLAEERNVQLRLQPFFIAMKTVENAIKGSPDLVCLNKSPLPREQLLDFDKRIISVASQFGMEAVSVDVKMDEIKRGDLVVVEACLMGNFKDFQRFLLHLGQISWVQDFESLDIRGYRNQEQLNIAFKLALE